VKAHDELDLGMRRFVLPLAFVLLLFGALWWRRPAPAPENASPPPAPTEDVLDLGGRIFGTTWSARVVGASAPSATVASWIQEELDAVNAAMSTYAPTSELSRLNANPSTEAVPVSAELLSVLEVAQETSRASGGAFDVTIGPLVNVWGFGAAEVLEPPDEATLARAKASVGYEHLTLDPTASTVRRARPDLYIDLSAVAKGYGVDRAGQRLEREGLVRYLVEVGGEVRARGQGPDGRTWRLGIETPDGGAPDVAEAVALTETSLATSGSYRQSVLVDGRPVTHILDARSGEPVMHGLGSVSVLSRDCVDADAWATALYVLGAEQGLALAESRGMAALFLTMREGAVERRASAAWPHSSALPLAEPRSGR
jgi:thiamine biosynthesis lipoprotein